MATIAIPCSKCGRFPRDSIPKEYTAAEVGVLIDMGHEDSHRAGVNEAIAAVMGSCSSEDGLNHWSVICAAIREATGVKE